MKEDKDFRYLLTYLLPRYLYSFQTPVISAKFLTVADKLVRGFVNSYLHLPSRTANALLYTDRRGGRLGIPCLMLKIPAILLSRLSRHRGLQDPHVSAALAAPFIARLQHWLRDAGRTPTSQKGYWRSCLERSAYGHGLPGHVNRPFTSGWLVSPPPFWTGADYVEALQFRTNTFPTVGGLHNTRLPYAHRRCRAGCDRVESLCHVLQKCPIVHYERIRRHDHTVRLLKRFATPEGWSVEVEPHIRGEDGILKKPDLLLRRGNTLVVVDVSICWESPNPLAIQYQHKNATYSSAPFISALRRRLPGCDIYCRALIIGARGDW